MLLPSRIGFLLYFMLGLAVVGLHVLMVTLSGQAYPTGLDDVVLQWYANTIIQPLATLFNNGTFNNALTILLWGGIGFVIYETIAGFSTNFQAVREARKDITMPQEGVVVRHPLERTVVIRLLWRLLVGVLIIAFSLGVQPLIHYAFVNDERLMNAAHLSSGLTHGLMSVAIWMGVFHIYVVLFRMYVMRVRVLGNFLFR